MSETPKIVIFDGLTQTEITRELNSEELDELAERVIAEQARQAEEQARANAKASAIAKLAKLGLTQAEIDAL
jgi:hypothetical protein